MTARPHYPTDHLIGCEGNHDDGDEYSGAGHAKEAVELNLRNGPGGDRTQALQNRQPLPPRNELGA
ncbi:hypothetical protein ABQE44_24110 [Mycolicibacterium sp. XJ2546]